MHIRPFILIVVAAALVTGCNNSATEQTTHTDSTQHVATVPPQSKLNDLGTSKLVNMLNGYYELKDAMVATNASKADEAAKKLLAATTDMGSYIKTDSANTAAITPYLDTVTTGSNALLALKDETCEKKRIEFDKISSAMYGLLKTADLKNAMVYHEFCPMAFNDKGAYWLSNESEIKNPYFGKKMLECGEVTDSMK